jgi:hypothetical protein
MNKNIMNSLSDSRQQIKTSSTSNYDSFGLGREYDLMEIKKEKKGRLFNQDKIEILNDRDLFNKTSNMNEELDMSNNDFLDSFGMPMFGGQIFKNKKSLIRTPFIQEHNNKDDFVSSGSDMHESFASIGGDKRNKREKNMDSLTSMGYNGDENEYEDDDSKCKVEKDIVGFEYDLNMEKNKEFLFDVNSPFALAYLWKSIIILTKNPTTNKILTALNIERKEFVASDLKKYSNIFKDLGDLKFYIPVTDNQVDSGVLNKLFHLYNIDVNVVDDIRDYEESEHAEIHLKYDFSLEIPTMYQPKEKYDYFLGFKKNKTKFIEMSNVIASLVINEQHDFVNLEIPMGSSLILGFLYGTERQVLDNINYDFITSNKKPNTLIKSLIIPKINRNKKSEYSKNFKDILSSVHFGEISYGKMYNVSIKINVTLDIEAVDEEIKIKNKIQNKIDKININHPCYFYIKHENIPNRIFINGFINY